MASHKARALLPGSCTTQASLHTEQPTADGWRSAADGWRFAVGTWLQGKAIGLDTVHDADLPAASERNIGQGAAAQPAVWPTSPMQ